MIRFTIPSPLLALLRPMLVAALAVLLVPLSTAAQPGRSGLTGTAIDEEGQPVAGLEIVLRPVGGTASRDQVVKTDRRGRFANRVLPPGRYVLELADTDRFFIKEARVEVRDPNGIVLNSYEITTHPKEGLTPTPVQGGQITNFELVITGADYRERLIRQIEGAALQGEIGDVVRLFNEGNLEEALALGRRLMDETTTELPHLLHLMGMTYSRLDRFEEAEPLLRRALEIEPNEAEFRAGLGTMLLELARTKEAGSEEAKAAFGEAEVALGQAIAAMPSPPAALLINRVIALEGAGKPDAAVELLEQVAAADPDNVVLRLRLAALLRSLGRPERALEVLATLPGGGDPRAVDSLYNVALTFFNDEDYQSARAALEHAVDLNPDHALSQRLLARVYVVQEKPGLAIPHLRRFLELEPDHPEADMEREWLAYLEKTTGSK